MYNSALHAGGVFFAVTSNLQFDGNQKYQPGGKSNLCSSATIGFQNNLAGGSGGVVTLRELSSLTINGSVLLERNSAAVSGGALALYDSLRIEVIGNVSLIDNHVDISLKGTNLLRRYGNIDRRAMQKRAFTNVTAVLFKDESEHSDSGGGAFYAEFSNNLHRD